MTRRTVEAAGSAVRLVGWVEGEGVSVLLDYVGTVPYAGYFMWLDAPGRVRAALDKPVRSAETGSYPGSGAG